jgi:hypothetical protein
MVGLFTWSLWKEHRNRIGELIKGKVSLRGLDELSLFEAGVAVGGHTNVAF